MATPSSPSTVCAATCDLQHKRVKVDIHRLDNPSPCENSVDGSSPLSGENRINNTEKTVEEGNLHKINNNDDGDHEKKENLDDEEMKEDTKKD